MWTVRTTHNIALGMRAIAVLVCCVMECVAEDGMVCTNNFECELKRRAVGSECRDGVCTNPFYNGGCLKNVLPEWKNLRTCSSDDPPEAQASGACRESQMRYNEVRIGLNNWPTSFVTAWILQIILSELADIPVSFELGDETMTSSMYHEIPGFGTMTAFDDFDPLRTSQQVVDCLEVKQEAEYRACYHISMELWESSIESQIPELLDQDVIETPTKSGHSGQEKFYLPKRTAEKNPAFVSYFGLKKSVNQRAIAETFLTPTTWGAFCDEISATNCTEPDATATRPPEESERGSYFMKDSYTGHFRKTFLNDCDLNPNCTGFFIDYAYVTETSSFQLSYRFYSSLQTLLAFVYDPTDLSP